MNSISELVSLRGRTALITGAAGGLGSTIAKALYGLGADLILVDKNEMEFLDGNLKGNDTKIIYEVSELESNIEREALIRRVETQVGKLDILINNAAFVGTSGLEGWNTRFEDQSIDTWRRAIEVNLTAPFHLCRGLLPLLRASESASIINIGSIYGISGPDWRLYEGTKMGNPAAYAASKGGLIQFTRWLATTLAPSIRANCISPGGVWRAQSQEFIDRYVDRTPMRRMAVEIDFVGAAIFLATDMSKYITGQNIAVDGGWGVW